MASLWEERCFLSTPNGVVRAHASVVYQETAAWQYYLCSIYTQGRIVHVYKWLGMRSHSSVVRALPAQPTDQVSCFLLL